MQETELRHTITPEVADRIIRRFLSERQGSRLAHRYVFDPETGDYKGCLDGETTTQERGGLGVFLSGDYNGDLDDLKARLLQVRYSDIGQVAWT